MKEKNKNRKLQLRLTKEAKERKRALHKDIADFIINLQLMQTAAPLVAIKYFLRNGGKGFYKMRGRPLIARFEEDAKKLREPKHTMMFYQKKSQWADDDTDDRRLSKDQERLKIRERMILESDSIMNRLIELSFDLDFED